MRGIEYAKDVVALALRQRLPAVVDGLHDRLGLDRTLPREALAAPAGAAVPPPDGWVVTDAHVAVGEPHRTLEDRWPQWFVAGRDLLGVVTDGPGGYAFRYRLRVYVLADGNEYDETDRRRDRLLLATREALLGAPLLAGSSQQPGQHADDVDGTAKLLPTTVAESYADVGVDDDGRTVEAGYVEFAVDVHEELHDAGGPPPEGFDIVGSAATGPPDVDDLP